MASSHLSPSSPLRPLCSFFHNKGAVAGVFTVVGLIALIIFFILGTTFIRKRRARKFDKEIDEAIPTLTSKTLSGENLEIVGRYLKKQVRQEWPSEFLTSDLMGYLAVKDGCPAVWQRSVL